MKTKLLWSMLLCAFILTAACSNDSDDEGESKTGLIKFKTLNPLHPGSKQAMSLKSTGSNPSLTGDTTIANTTSFKLCVGDVWVSQDEVTAGLPDDFNWVRLTASTNAEFKLFEDYSFSEVEIPEGTYKSVKITFRNIFYRYAQLVSDSTVAYELFETMGSWTDACNEDDTTWAKTNYFGPDGNHKLNDGNLLELVAEGEKLGGFSIEAGKTAIVTWRLGAGVNAPCVTYLIDQNTNLEWDCGIDRMEFDCPPEALYMWDFIVAYE